ncbi:MAG: NrtA/SsuA/CpmA family ABC transporter substrate-binding protein [Syntrophales bacterium]|jgi:NitT/TauT family transport system substrate-binding protein|nr:NrtA/SsuA/CpmA family ABC transporter substrate-binding protein [Syntrophales bacterium]
MTKSRPTSVALIFIAVCALAFFLWPAGREKKYDGPSEEITVGVANVMSTALFDIAAARGLFRDQGLELKLVAYETGVEAVDDLLKNKLDAATATEFVAVTKHSRHLDIRLLASISRPELHEVIARRDRGITEPAHLKGKRIAVTRNSSGDFFLETFIAHQGIPAAGVTFVDLPPPRIPPALSSGAVDAAMAWEPMVGQIKEHLGANAVHWSGQSGQAYYLMLITREDFVRERPRTVEHLLRALIEAEKFAASHTLEAQEILAKRRGYDLAAVQSLWPRCDFRVRLDQDLLTLMEDEAKWSIRHKRLKTEVPNYLAVIHWESLKKIKPEAVGIIH